MNFVSPAGLGGFGNVNARFSLSLALAHSGNETPFSVPSPKHVAVVRWDPRRGLASSRPRQRVCPTKV
jgi:hypothetical protein